MILTPGTVVDRYVVKGVLGRGGIATVYRVKHSILGTEHALKVLHGDEGSNVAERLVYEGQLQAKLDARSVVPVHDVLRVGDAPALLMPLVEGCSLRDLLKVYSPQEEEIAYVLHGIAKGLRSAHEQGITHRDLKPGNILLEMRHGQLMVRVADFGIARKQERAMDTQHSGMLGTLAYASPEQLCDPTAVDPRADLWSFGVVAYEMLVGKRPFSAAQTGTLLHLILTGKCDLSPLREPWRTDIGNLLRVEPDERTESIEAVCAILENRAPQTLSLNGGMVAALERRVADQQSADPEEALPELTLDLNTNPKLDQTPHSLSSKDSNLPKERNTFHGQTEALETLHELVSAGHRQITLLGIGGLGKTRLAIHYGWKHFDMWPGGVWFCDLAEATTRASVLATVARTFQVPLDSRSPDTQLGNVIDNLGRTLIIFDNLEQVIDDVRPLLRTWLQHSNDSVFLATSQVVVGLGDERVLALPTLDVVSANWLFLDRARRVKDDFFPDEDTLEVIQTLVERLDHLPLAIELAAARVSIMSPERMLSRLNERFRLLASRTRENERHRTLRAALDWSWGLLTDWEQSALAQMSVFEGGFDLEAAEGVIDLSPFSNAPWAIDAVQSLVEKSLVRRLGDDRFGLLVSVQAYAREKLSGFHSAEATETRHGAYFANFGSRDALRSLNHYRAAKRFKAFNLEIDNFMVAANRAIARADVTMTQPLMRAVSKILSAVGPYGVAVDLTNRALAMPGIDQDSLVYFHYQASMAHWRIENVGEAQQHIDGALRNLSPATCHSLRGDVHKAAALCQERLGQVERVRSYYRSAISSYRQGGDVAGEAATLVNAGVHYRRHNDVEEATRLFERAVHLYGTRNERGRSIALGEIATTLRTQGNLNEAAALIQDCLKTFRAFGDKRTMCVFLNTLGLIDLDTGHYERARSTFTECTSISRKIGDRRHEAVALCNLADAEYLAGTFNDAVRSGEAGLHIAASIHPVLASAIGGTLAKSYIHTGDAHRALTVLQEREAAMRGSKYKPEIAKFLAKTATVYGLRHDWAGARKALDEAIAIHAALGGVSLDITREIDEAKRVLAGHG